MRSVHAAYGASGLASTTRVRRSVRVGRTRAKREIARAHQQWRSPPGGPTWGARQTMEAFPNGRSGRSGQREWFQGPALAAPRWSTCVPSRADHRPKIQYKNPCSDIPPPHLTLLSVSSTPIAHSTRRTSLITSPTCSAGPSRPTHRCFSPLPGYAHARRPRLLKHRAGRALTCLSTHPRARIVAIDDETIPVIS